MGMWWRSMFWLACAAGAALLAGEARATYISTGFEAGEGYTRGKLTPSQPNPIGDVGRGNNTWTDLGGKNADPQGLVIFTGTQGMDSFNVIKGQFVINEGFRADLNVDGAVDARDLAVLAGDWLLDAATIAIVTESALWPWADINRDAVVNLLDFRSLAENWRH